MKLPTNETELKEFQEKVDTMVQAFNDYKLQVAVLDDKLNTSLGFNGALQIALDNLMGVIKNVHITLNANNELFTGNDQIEEMMQELSKFIISSESIKSGVRQNAIN